MITIDYPWYFVLFCLLAGGIYAAVLYTFGKDVFGKRQRIALASLRFLAVSAIAFLLLGPIAKQTVHERQLPRVVLLQDTSGSAKEGRDSAFTFDAFAQSLEGNLDVNIETFGNSSYTDIGAALLRHQHDNLSAIVMASDGLHNRGIEPTTAASRLSCPIYTIALGDTTPIADAALSDLNTPRYAMLGNKFPVEVTVNATFLNGLHATLTISDSSGSILASKPVEYSSEDFSATYTFAIEAKQAGLRRFRAAIAPLGEEALQTNNTATFYIDVIDTRQKVAIVAHAPHPDIGALKRSIETNPNYEATIVMASDAENGKWKPDGQCSMVILHNLPSRAHPDIGYATGLPRLFIIGMQTDLPRFNALHSGLEIVSRTTKANEVTALWQEEFALFSFDPTHAEVIEHLPPLNAPFGEARLAPGIQTFFNARVGNIDSRQPLIAATAQDALRQSFIWGEGIWRWRMAEHATNGNHESTDRLIAQLISFTSMQHRNDRLQVEAARTFPEGEHPVLRAMLYNEAFEPTNSLDLSLHLSGDSIAEADFNFRKEGNGYKIVLPTLPHGIYRYTATSGNLNATGLFAVEALNLEQRRLVAEPATLRSISATSGGEMYYPDQLPRLHSTLSSLKPTIHTHSRYSDLSRLPLVLLLIALLLSAEWFLRKYNGQI